MDSDTTRTTGAMILLLALLLHILLLLAIFIFQPDFYEPQVVDLNDFETPVLLDFDPLPQSPQLPQLQPQAQQPTPQQTPQPMPIDKEDLEVLVELIAQGTNPNDTLTREPGEIVRDEPTPIPGSLQQESIPPTDADEAHHDDVDQNDDIDESQDADIDTTQDEISEQKSSDQPLENPGVSQEKSSERPLIDVHDFESIAHAFVEQKTPAPVQAKPAAQTSPIKKIVRKIVKRPPLTPPQAQALSKLAQGFMQSMNAELGGKPSNDPIHLAHQRYMTKLWNSLKQAANAEHNVLALSNDIDTQATLVLTINKKGQLVHALLRHPRKTSDILKMENMLIANAHRVGLFPPLPESFHKEEATFVMPIHLRALQGVHSGYRLQVEP